MKKQKCVNNCQSYLFRTTIIFLSTLLILASGCAFNKQYVGMEVDTSSWPKYSSGVKRTISTDAALFEFTITESGEEGEYLLEGTMDGTRGSVKSFNHLVIRDCRFSIILSKNNVIVDNITFFPKGSDHRQKLPFTRSFKSAPFDSFTVTYEMSVRG